MKRALVIFCILFSVVTCQAQYEKQWGFSQKGGEAFAISSMSSFIDGYVMLGAFADSADFGVNKLYSTGGTDVFLLQMDGNGHTTQAASYGSDGNDYPAGMDTSENTLFVLTSSEHQLSLLSFDEDLQQQASLGFPIEKRVNADVLQVETDRFLIGGSLKGSLTVGDQTIDSKKVEHAFLVSLTRNGDFIASWQSSGTGKHRLHSFTKDADEGYTIVVNVLKGSFESPGLDPVMIKKNGVLILKLDIMMQPQWIQTMECSGFIEATSLIQQSDGCCIAVNYGGSLVCGEKTLTAEGQLNSLLVKLDDKGSCRWSAEIVSDDYCRILDLANASESVVCTGYHYGQLGIDDETLSKTIERKAFLIVFSDEGEYRTHIDIDSFETSIGQSLVADSTSFVLGGTKQPAFDRNKANHNENDVFAQKFLMQAELNGNLESDSLQISENSVIVSKHDVDNTPTDFQSCTLEVFPNPVRSILYWSISKADDWLLELFDTEGHQLLRQRHKNKSSGCLDLTNCIIGPYILRFSASGTSIQQVIIKD